MRYTSSNNLVPSSFPFPHPIEGHRIPSLLPLRASCITQGTISCSLAMRHWPFPVGAAFVITAWKDQNGPKDVGRLHLTVEDTEPLACEH